MSRYACREHPDEPVTWRGTGCTECDNRPPRGRDRRPRPDTRRVADLDLVWFDPAPTERTP